MQPFGITLVIIGILMIICTGFNLKTEEKVLDVGPVEINKEENHPVNWSPIAGGVILAGGIILLITARKR